MSQTTHLEEVIVQNIELASTVESVFSLPLKTIFSILSKIDFSKVNNRVNVIQNIIKYTNTLHGDEKEALYLIKHINAKNCSFTFEEYAQILQCFNNCDLCMKIGDFCKDNKGTTNKEVTRQLSAAEQKTVDEITDLVQFYQQSQQQDSLQLYKNRLKRRRANRVQFLRGSHSESDLRININIKENTESSPLQSTDEFKESDKETAEAKFDISIMDLKIKALDISSHIDELNTELTQLDKDNGLDLNNLYYIKDSFQTDVDELNDHIQELASQRQYYVSNASNTMQNSSNISSSQSTDALQNLYNESSDSLITPLDENNESIDYSIDFDNQNENIYNSPIKGEKDEDDDNDNESKHNPLSKIQHHIDHLISTAEKGEFTDPVVLNKIGTDMIRELEKIIAEGGSSSDIAEAQQFKLAIESIIDNMDSLR